MDDLAEPLTLLKLSQVSKEIGVSGATLRMLISDNLLPGVERDKTGHVKIRADSVPSYGDVVELVHHQLIHHLERAQRQMRRVHAEMEAVDNDIALALEEPLADLGHDFLTVRSYSGYPARTSLSSTLQRLEMISHEVQSYQDALRELGDVTPAQGT